MYAQNEIPLIIQRKINHAHRFQIHNQGIEFLRNLSTKKLRIILNVSTGLNISLFSETFMTGISSEQNLIQHNDMVSTLTIMRDIQILTPDEILIMMNAHQTSSNIHCYYLLFAYLISSVIIFHSDSELHANSDLIHALSIFHDTIKTTNIRDLNSEIKLPSGFDKKPYFVYLIHNTSKDSSIAKENFLNFFKGVNQTSSKDLKKSADVILDYLPNRTSFYIPNGKQNFVKDCSKMKSSFLMTLVGRKIFNFQITGAAIENLCLELFQLVNSKPDKIDLLQLYSRVISNQKRRVLTEGIQYYLKRASALIQTYNMPYDPEQLYELHEKAMKQILEYIILMASNCMDLSEFISLWSQLMYKMEQNFLDLQINNGKASQQFNLSLKEQLQVLEITQIQLMVEQINQKIDHFNFRSKGSDAKESLCELFKDFLEQFSDRAINRIKELEKQQFDSEIKMYEIKLKLQRLEDENVELRRKCQRNFIEKQIQIITHTTEEHDQIPNQKQKYDMFSQQNSRFLIRQLEEECIRRQTQSQDLQRKVDNYQARFSKQKNKSKGDIANLVREFGSSLKDFQKLFQRMQRVDEIIKVAKKEIQKQKQQFCKDRDKQIAKISKLQQKNSFLILQQQEYKENVARAQETIQLYKQIVQFNKNSMQVNAHEIINQKIELAQTEARLLVYQKCIQLICQSYKKGKNDSLMKFLKLIEYDEVRDYVLAMLKK